VAEPEVAEPEGVAAVEVAGALVVGVARAPRCNQHRWHQRRSNHRRFHQGRLNQCPGHQRRYLPGFQRPARSLPRMSPLTIGGRQHCRCHVRGPRNLHRPLVRQLGRSRLFQTDPRRRGPAHRRQHRQAAGVAAKAALRRMKSDPAVMQF
jgi:hypothetical protein